MIIQLDIAAQKILTLIDLFRFQNGKTICNVTRSSVPFILGTPFNGYEHQMDNHAVTFRQSQEKPSTRTWDTVGPDVHGIAQKINNVTLWLWTCSVFIEYAVVNEEVIHQHLFERTHATN